MTDHDQQKKCAHCREPFGGDDARQKVETMSGPVTVHRSCTLVPELEAALAALEAESQPEERRLAIVNQLRRRVGFFRDVEEQAAKRQAEGPGGGFEYENIVEEAARLEGFGSRVREWASEALLREAQRIVYGAASIALKADWEAEARRWQGRAQNLRAYLQQMFVEALTVKKPDLTKDEIIRRGVEHTESIESGKKTYEDGKKLIVVAKTIPKGKKPS